MTGAEFKKQIAKPFGKEMRLHGFKGTGLEYIKQTSDYLFAAWIELGRWGGNCSSGFAVHPKLIVKDSEGRIDLTKLKIYQYEWKMGLTETAQGIRWPYAEKVEGNLATLGQIIETIKQKAFPVFEQFLATPDIIEKFSVTEMNDFHENWIKRTGVDIGTTDIRFAWGVTVIFEKRSPEKAKQFANWVISQPDEAYRNWFGMKDIKRVLKIAPSK